VAGGAEGTRARAFVIRRARAEDAAELARLLSPLGYPLTEADVAAVWDAWEAEGNLALVAGPGDAGAALLGAITLHSMTVLHRPRPVGRITSLIVDAAARGEGLGRALMAAAEEALARRGCAIVEVTSHVRRSDAHTFYRHFGYERTSHRFARELGAEP
jgi:ribosomal protein S18 acetylase RimI-like enzyme